MERAGNMTSFLPSCFRSFGTFSESSVIPVYSILTNLTPAVKTLTMRINYSSQQY